MDHTGSRRLVSSTTRTTRVVGSSLRGVSAWLPHPYRLSSTGVLTAKVMWRNQARCQPPYRGLVDGEDIGVLVNDARWTQHRRRRKRRRRRYPRHGAVAVIVARVTRRVDRYCARFVTVVVARQAPAVRHRRSQGACAGGGGCDARVGDEPDRARPRRRERVGGMGDAGDSRRAHRSVSWLAPRGAHLPRGCIVIFYPASQLLLAYCRALHENAWSGFGFGMRT